MQRKRDIEIGSIPEVRTWPYPTPISEGSEYTSEILTADFQIGQFEPLCWGFYEDAFGSLILIVLFFQDWKGNRRPTDFALCPPEWIQASKREAERETSSLRSILHLFDLGRLETEESLWDPGSDFNLSESFLNGPFRHQTSASHTPRVWGGRSYCMLTTH